MSRIDYKKFLDDSMLSPQEKQILKYRQDGIPGRQIAEKLGIKIESVWSISHIIVLKCTGRYDNKKQYRYTKKTFERKMSESEDNQIRFKEQQKKYRDRNKDKKKEYNKKYYLENKEKIAKQQKEYYEKHRSKEVLLRKAERVKRNNEICKMFLDGETVQDISNKLGLSKQMIHRVLLTIK